MFTLREVVNRLLITCDLVYCQIFPFAALHLSFPGCGGAKVPGHAFLVRPSFREWCLTVSL